MKRRTKREWEQDDDRFGRFCIGCGCCDTVACESGCSWLVVDGLVNVGVCSNCLAYRSVLPALKPEQLRRIYREKVAKAEEWA